MRVRPLRRRDARGDAHLHGLDYPAGPISEAWQQVAFNQFHDILCGSATNESNRESVGSYDLALDKAREAQYASQRRLAAAVPSSGGDGQPLVVFNTLPFQRTDVVEAEVFSYVAPPAATVRTWGYGSPHPKPGTWVQPIIPVDVGQDRTPPSASRTPPASPSTRRWSTASSSPTAIA